MKQRFLWLKRFFFLTEQETILSALLFILIVVLVSFEIKICSQFIALFPRQTSVFYTEDGWKDIFSQTALLAYANPQSVMPQRNWQIADFQSQAKAVLVYDLDKQRILYQKNADKKLPIASLTKLMTNLLVRENEPQLDKWLSFDQNVLMVEGHKDIFQKGESFQMKDLVKASLVASNNEATLLLAQSLEKQTGIKVSILMNKRARELGMSNTRFSNPIGFDGGNFSTSWDVLSLVRYILNTYPHFFRATTKPQIEIYSLKRRSHLLENSNRLISIDHLSDIQGSKTGYTDLAKGCMLLLRKFGNDTIILLILGSQDRHLEMLRLINWLNKAYIFS